MKKTIAFLGFLLTIYASSLSRSLLFSLRDLLPFSWFYYAWIILVIPSLIGLGIGLNLLKRSLAMDIEKRFAQPLLFFASMFLVGLGLGGLFLSILEFIDMVMVKWIL